MFHPITGAILAGGLSTRMGQDKVLLRLRDGRTMLEHVAQAMEGVCSQVVLIGARDPGQVRGFVVIDDLRPHCGPLGGIEALLASGIDPRGQYLVCPCDVPSLTTSILRLLTISNERATTVFHVQGRSIGEIEPLPARISAEALPAVRRLLDAGRRSVWMLMEELQSEVVSLTPDQARQLHNVNTSDDLRMVNDS